MTLELYARRKEWPLESVTVELSHEKVRAEGREEQQEGRQGYVDLIRRHIVVTGDLTKEQKARLGEIARRCPVHRTLTAASAIVDEVDLARP